MVRNMNIDDYDGVSKLWKSIDGFYIRHIDDSFNGIKKFLERNPDTNAVALHEDEIIGSILCGYDGRCAYLYHVCVRADFRHKGIGREMVNFTINALKRHNATHINLVAFKTNKVGNIFWSDIGWDRRDDLSLYEMILDSSNIRSLNKT